MRGRRRKRRERQRGRDWLLGADDFSTLKRELCTLDGFRFLLLFPLVFPLFSVLDFFSCPGQFSGQLYKPSFCCFSLVGRFDFAVMSLFEVLSTVS